MNTARKTPATDAGEKVTITIGERDRGMEVCTECERCETEAETKIQREMRILQRRVDRNETLIMIAFSVIGMMVVIMCIAAGFNG